jgi:hypothetical protein
MKGDEMTKETTSNNEHPMLFFGDRFWEQYVGHKMVSDPVIAIVELVANSWDAGAKRVDIEWPDDAGETLVITDDGEGMTKQEFLRRWGELSYDRSKEQALTIDVVVGTQVRKRRVFGRNGIGRFAAFCFASEYVVTTRKGGNEIQYLVKKGRTKPLDFEHRGESDTAITGTVIRIETVTGKLIREETVRIELGRRFLTDPAFEVHVNRKRIDFTDIEDKGLERILVDIMGLENPITVKVIDAKRTDPTGRQHGVAWHVLGRLVGDCDWKDPEQRSLIDGRRVEAKRFTFIVEADLLHDIGAVKPDWSGFHEDNESFKTINIEVQAAITKRLLEVSREKREETTANIRRSFRSQIGQMTPLKREKWNLFVEQVAEQCPSLTETELKSVAGVLANMEVAGSQYALLHKLHELSPDQIDDLHIILEEWTVDVAKIVLDEIKVRIKLVEELRLKTSDPKTLEVQELQPLFEQGLWIFGPEFETIHYTSNQGMTRVIQEIYPHSTSKGSRNRPDFAIVPDGSVGIYSYDEYDDEGGEIGPECIVIVELKAPNVPIAHAHKEQCYKYIRELAERGVLTNRTKVRGFVLGRSVNPIDRGEKTEMDQRVKILPLDFDTVLRRAESRLLKLLGKVKAAPFLQGQRIQEFLEDDLVTNEMHLFEENLESVVS